MTAATLVYRLVRQRRLLALCIALPLAGAALSGLGSVGLYSALMVAAALTLLLVLLPASYIEAISMALATAVTLPMVPLLGGIIARAGPEKAQTVTVLLAALVVLGWLLLSLVFAGLIAMLQNVRVGTRSYGYRTTLPLSLQEAVDAFVPRPGHRMAMRTCGPEGEDGRFRVDLRLEYIDPITFERVTRELPYHARIVAHEEAPDSARYVLESFLGWGEHETTSITELSFAASRKGTVLACREVHDHFTALAALGFWLRDAGADHARAELDGYLGRPSPSVAYGTQITLLGLIGRGLVAIGLYRPRDNSAPF